MKLLLAIPFVIQEKRLQDRALAEEREMEELRSKNVHKGASIKISDFNQKLAQRTETWKEKRSKADPSLNALGRATPDGMERSQISNNTSKIDFIKANK